MHRWLVLIMVCSAMAWGKNGFDLNGAVVPERQIFHGGPPRDGIPAIDAPLFVPADQADFLAADARVLGIYLDGRARAYPINIMNWHEIVNDRFGDKAVVITYCPLCGTGMAFSAQFGGRALSFGVSGLLYQSDVLLYDRQTLSLWSQIMRQAVSGAYSGTELQQLPMAHTRWQAWLERHPDTEVLSTQTCFERDYEKDPYRGYGASPVVYFDINHRPPAMYHPKEQVMGLVYKGKARAWPFQELERQGKAEFVDDWQGERLTVEWDAQARSARLLSTDGELLPSTTAFWFAWYTFHPDTSVYQVP